MSEMLILTTKLKEDRDYWMGRLSREAGVSNLPLDFKRSKVYSQKQDSVEINLRGDVYRKLLNLTSDSSFLIYTTLMTALVICLRKYSGNKTVVVGSPAYKGDEGEFDQVNALAIVEEVEDGANFRQLLLQVRETLSEAYARQDYAYGTLLKDLSLGEADNKCPLFDIALVFEQIHSVLPDVRNDLTISFRRGEGELSGRVKFNARLFRRDTVERFTRHYLHVLEEALKNTNAPVREIALLAGEEREQVLFRWNDTSKNYPRELCIQQLFEAQVERTPGQIAATFEGERLTYSELNSRANRLAHHLRRLGVANESLVAVCMERSLEMLVGILGILKAGAAYVPLDPAYPEQRLSFMLEDAGVAVVLTQERVASSLPVEMPGAIRLDADWKEMAAQPQTNLAAAATPDNLAYVLYTSGSTGNPKGVAMSHRALVNLISWQLENSERHGAARTLQFASLSFDVSFQEIFSTLCAGGTLVLVSEQVRRDSVALARYLADEEVERLFLPFVALQQLAEASDMESAPAPGLREIITAGEQLQVTQPVIELCRRLRDCSLVNHYGPTESHVVTSFRLENSPSRWPTLPPIGRPVANAQVFLLDPFMQPVPVGVPGELYIGGLPLARGYLKRPELTAEKFVPNPYSTEPGARLYKTGDLARFMSEGEIEFLGRIDHQVKIRGFRVELGEIEAALCQHPSIREAAVMVREDVPGDKRLVAYIVASQEPAPTTAELRRLVKERLPEYMVPAAFMVLDALPLTPSGKVDRRALPARDNARPELEKEFVAPRTHVEELLTRIWAEVLGVEKVGIHDNFFELGGDSILTVQVVAKANRAGLRVMPKQLFQHQTIAGLATVVDTSPAINAEQTVVTGAVPLTPIQHWFFEQELVDAHHFNMGYLFEVPETLDPSLLERAVQHLLVHHDALRLRFSFDDGEWHQAISAPSSAAPFSRFDFSALSEDEQRTRIEQEAGQLQRSLSLEAGELVRVAHFWLGAGRAGRVLMVVHHLAVDGVSWRVLVEDVQRGYEQLVRGEEVALGAKTTSWKQWGEAIAERAGSEEVERELGYWEAEERKKIEVLPVDFPDGANVEAGARIVTVSLTGEETDALLREVPRAFQTRINDVLLMALTRAFARWTGSASLLVDLEGHGREEISDDVDISRTVGWFTIIYPVLLKLGDDLTTEEALTAIKHQLQAIPNRGIGYGLLRYLNRNPAVGEKLRALPRPEVSFNYIGQVDQSFDGNSFLKPVAEPIGAIAAPGAKLPHKIYVNGIVFQGQLHMRFKHSENLYRAETIERLADDYLAELRSVVNECRSSAAKRPGASDFPLLKLEQETLDRAFEQVSFKSEAGKLGWQNIEDAYPLSPSQEGILFHSLYAPETGVYVVQISCTFRGLNVEAVERAWRRVVERHPVLRTAFVWGDLEKPLQAVGREVELPFDKQDWRAMSAREQEESFASYLQADRSRGFELSEAPLMRFALLQIDEHTYHFVWSHHHLLLDGWSIFLVLKEVFTYYDAFSQGRQLELPQNHPYRDYLTWLQEQDLPEAKAFWQKALKGFTSPTPLRLEGTPDGVEGFGEQVMLLPSTATAELQSFARQNQLTLNTLVQGAWSLLLSHHSGEHDVLFGATAAGRPATLEGIEEMVGIFINVLPMRAKFSPADSLLSWLKAHQQTQFEVRGYEYSPLAQVQRWSEVPRGQKLFESILSFENYPVDDRVGEYSRNLELSNVRSISQTNYPITLIVAPLTELKVRLVYDRSRFHQSAIKRLMEQLSLLLRAFVAEPEASISTLLDMLARNEKSRVVSEQTKAERANSTRFKKARPRVINLPQGELIKKSYLDPERKLPLVIEPALTDVELVDWAKDNREQVEAELLKRGALLFRGFKVDAASKFEQFAQSICPELYGEYGDLPRAGVGGKVYGSTPYPADKAILFHNESSHMQRWPMKIWFYCLRAAEQGGETPFVDCRKAFQLLSPKTRERLAEKKLMYVRNFIEGLDVSWQSFFRTTDRTAVEASCREAGVEFEWRNGSGLRTRQVRPAVVRHPKTGEMVFFNQIQLHHVSCLEPELRASLLSVFEEDELPRNVYYGDGTRLEDSVIEEINEVYRQTVVSFPWREGDILMLDNMLTAHGRYPFTGERKIVVAMGEMVGRGVA